jgi:hypothetical protein
VYRPGAGRWVHGRRRGGPGPPVEDRDRGVEITESGPVTARGIPSEKNLGILLPSREIASSIFVSGR